MAVPAAQLGPISPVAPVRDHISQQRPCAHIIYVVAVVLAAADGNHGSPEQGAQAQQGASEVASGVYRLFVAVVHRSPPIGTPIAILPATTTTTTGTNHKQAHLAGQEETQVAQTREAEAAVAAGEAAPAVVQHVVARLGADVDANQLVLGGAGCGLAAGDQVRPRAAHHVLDRVGQEARQDQRDGEPQDGDVVFVPRGARQAVGEDDDHQGHGGGVDHVEGHGHALDLGVGEGYGQVIDVEQAVEGLDEEDDLWSEAEGLAMVCGSHVFLVASKKELGNGRETDQCVCGDQDDEADIVWCVGTLWVDSR